MNSNDYRSWAEEYYESARNLHRAMEKYKAQLNKCANREYINGIIHKYRNLYYDTLNIGKMLEQKAIKLESGVEVNVA